MTTKKKPPTCTSIAFKSTPSNFEKEKSGVKPNTFRKIKGENGRFGLLRRGFVERIRIVNSITGDYFERTITDYTEYDDWAIISWKHPSTIKFSRVRELLKPLLTAADAYFEAYAKGKDEKQKLSDLTVETEKAERKLKDLEKGEQK